MVIIISGATHTGKTNLAQKLLEKYRYPYLSLDHLKMGLIRSKQTELTPEDDNELTDYLWPITREIIKTVIENKQNLIIEGCYVPFEYKKDFDDRYLREIQYICLVMSEKYIDENFEDIKEYANIIEKRLDDSYITKETLKKENRDNLRQCVLNNLNYCLIDNEYLTNCTF